MLKPDIALYLSTIVGLDSNVRVVRRKDVEQGGTPQGGGSLDDEDEDEDSSNERTREIPVLGQLDGRRCKKRGAVSSSNME